MWEGILIFLVISLSLLILIIYKLIYNKNRLYNPIIKNNYSTTTNSCIFVPKLIKGIPYYNRNLTFPDFSVNVKCYSTKVRHVKPVKKYENADKERHQILKENQGKSGVYRWRNLINGKRYIGSSINLNRRFRDYFSIYHLESVIKKKVII